MYRKIDTEEKV